MTNMLSRILAGHGNDVEEEAAQAARLAALAQGDDDDKKKDDDKAEGDDDDDKKKDDDKAEGDDDDDKKKDDDKAEGDDDDKKKDDDKAEGDDDDKKKDDDEAAAAASAQSRIKTILRAPEAKGRESLAQHIALETDLTAANAIAVLDAAPKETAGGLAAAMDRITQPDLGPGAEAGGEGGPGGDAAVQTASRLAGYVNARAPRT